MIKAIKFKLVLSIYFICCTAALSFAQLTFTVQCNIGYTITCNSPSLVLQASSNYSMPVNFTWISPQSTVHSGNTCTATSAGNYTISALSGSVNSTQTLTLFIDTIRPVVNISANGSNSIACLTSTLILTSTVSPINASLLWLEPGSGSPNLSSTCIAAIPGDYGLVATNITNGCFTVKTLKILDASNSICVGLVENELEQTKVYPNPIKDRLTIECPDFEMSEFRVEIFNSLGQIMVSLNSVNQKQEIDLNFLSNGVYFLKLQNNSEQKTFKIIKE